MELTKLDGTPLSRETVEGKVVLYVNVASQCGLTPQYTGLVELHQRYRDRGFTVVGVPSNQFMGQEPGSPDEIANFCSITYGVDFPLLEKQEVNGPNRSALYHRLVGDGPDIHWNFEKFLVGRDGAVLARFHPKVQPDDPSIVSAIEQAL